MASITVKMITYGLLIGWKQIKEVEKKHQGKFTQEVMMWLAVLSEGIGPLVLFEKGTLDHHGSTVCCSMTRKQSIWKQLDLSTRRQSNTYSLRNARLLFPTFLEKDR